MKNTCDFCGKGLSTPSNLAKHLRKVHKKTIPNRPPGPPPRFTKAGLTEQRKQTSKQHYTDHRNDINRKKQLQRALQASKTEIITCMSDPYAEWTFCEILFNLQELIKAWPVSESLKWEIRNHVYPDLKV
jgi:hypothetical protein